MLSYYDALVATKINTDNNAYCDNPHFNRYEPLSKLSTNGNCRRVLLTTASTSATLYHMFTRQKLGVKVLKIDEWLEGGRGRVKDSE